MRITNHLKKKFLTGLFVLIPLFVTVYIIYLVINSVDTVIAPFIRNLSLYVIGREMYIPGTGLIIFVVVAYVTGVLASNYIGNRFLSHGEAALRKIPFVKGIYNSVKDMTNAFSSEKKRSFKEVVLAEFPFPGRYAIGFVTNRTKAFSGKELCAVFVPTTPNPTSGYLIMVPENELIFLDMPVDNALKHIISLGTSGARLEWNEKRSSSS
ncbi:MAG: hypothetical protein A4E63_01064 [Syntrophorhabdus sp. PtaU1.Bin050]|nr:MAG: hypothetical protein A4E63_01064 [Syntrophorhabdus sp. PtaU1.Bin050]